MGHPGNDDELVGHYGNVNLMQSCSWGNLTSILFVGHSGNVNLVRGALWERRSYVVGHSGRDGQVYTAWSLCLISLYLCFSKSFYFYSFIFHVLLGFEVFNFQVSKNATICLAASTVLPAEESTPTLLFVADLGRNCASYETLLQGGKKTKQV